MSWPANPINGQETTINGILYSYDSAVGVWDKVRHLSATTVGDTPFADVSNTSAFSNVANIANIANVAYSISGANVSGTVSVANVAGTVTTNAQPNITSLGSLTSLTVTGTSTFSSSQDVTVSGTPSGTVNYDLYNGVVFDVAPTANWTANVGNIQTTNNRTSVVTFIITQGATPYLPTALQISGSAQTVKWINGSAPTGNANKIDVVSYSLIRSSAGAWTVLGQSATYG